jgi:hypothetical protein
MLPFLDGESSFQDSGRIFPCLLTKILTLMKVTQVLLYPGLAAVSCGRKKNGPKGRSINYNTTLQLDMFYKKEGKCTEVPYIQLFFFITDHPKWLSKCS